MGIDGLENPELRVIKPVNAVVVNNETTATTPPSLFWEPKTVAKVTGNVSLFQASNKPENGRIDNSLFTYAASKDEKDKGLEKEIPGYYVLKDDAARASLLRRKLEKIEDRNTQLSEYQRLTSKVLNKEDATIMSGTLPSLRNDVVVPAAKTLINIKGSEELRTHAGVAVANEIPKIASEKRMEVLQATLDTNNETVQTAAAPHVTSLAVEEQIKGTQAVIATKNEKVVNALAEVAYKTDITKQVAVAKALFETKYKSVQTSIAKTEGLYDKAKQLDIYSMLITSKHQDVKNTAAGNIYTMHEDNRAKAVEITEATKNAETIKSIAKTQAEAETKAAEVKAEEAKKEAETEGKKAEAKAQEAKIEAEKNRKADAEKGITATIAKITTAPPTEKNELIEETLKRVPATQQLAFIRMLPEYEQANALSIALQNSPSLDVISYAQTYSKTKDIKTKGTIEALLAKFSPTIVNPKIGLLYKNSQIV